MAEGNFELQPRAEITPAPPCESDSTDFSDAKPATGARRIPPLSEPPYLTFINDKGRYRPERPTKMRNSLLAGVGFLEAANAGDFAANVWNEVPVPIYAIVLMALGGTLAICIIYFAIKDAILSWRNLRALRAERYYLRMQRAHHSQDVQLVRTLDCLLDVNFREMGTEWVDRVGMDLTMGFGASMVGIGTFMAIDGTDPNVFKASNLMSGYIGNAPCALYGLANLFWSMYVWKRAHRHRVVGSKAQRTTRIEHMLKTRTSSVQLHGIVNGTTGVVAGAASLVTATIWWGYLILAPCIVSSVLVNFFWRNKIGYNRPLVQQVMPFDEDALVAELTYVDSCRQLVREFPSEPFSKLVSDPTSISCVIEFITRNQFFEEFSLRVLADTHLRAALFNASSESVTIDSKSLAIIDDTAARSGLLDVARALVNETASKCFFDQERYLLEVLGCYMCHPGENRHTKAPTSQAA